MGDDQCLHTKKEHVADGLADMLQCWSNSKHRIQRVEQDMQAGKDVMAEPQLQQTVHQMLTQAMDMFEQEYFKS